MKRTKSAYGPGGGYLVGRKHKEGGIKALNTSTKEMIEVEGNEVIITAPAVEDKTRRQFEGELLTNRQILSRINESGGGVAFADGGQIPKEIRTTGKKYNFGGKLRSDRSFVKSCGCKHADGGMAELRARVAAIKKMAEGGEVNSGRSANEAAEQEERAAQITGYQFLKKIEEQQGGYIKTAVVVYDDAYDEGDVEYERTKGYKIEYRVSWQDDETNSDPDVRIFDSIDKAYDDAQNPGDWWNGTRDHVKGIEARFRQVWLDRDGEVLEEDGMVGLYEVEDEVFEQFSSAGINLKDGDWLYYKEFGKRDEDLIALEEQVFAQLGYRLEGEYHADNGKIYQLKYSGTGKYSRINVVTDQGDYIGSVQLRISNHAYNPGNNNVDAREGNFISVEIDHSTTASRFNGKYSLRFNGRNDFENVVHSVNKRLREILDRWDFAQLDGAKKMAKGGEVSGKFPFKSDNPMEQAKALDVLKQHALIKGKEMPIYEYLESLDRGLPVGMSKMHRSKSEKGYIEKPTIGNHIVWHKADLDYYQYLEGGGIPYSQWLREKADREKIEADKNMEERKVQASKDRADNKNRKNESLLFVLRNSFDQVMKSQTERWEEYVRSLEKKKSLNRDQKSELSVAKNNLEATIKRINFIYPLFHEIYFDDDGLVVPRFTYQVGNHVQVFNHATGLWERGEIESFQEERSGDLTYKTKGTGLTNAYVGYPSLLPLSVKTPIEVTGQKNTAPDTEAAFESKSQSDEAQIAKAKDTAIPEKIKVKSVAINKVEFSSNPWKEGNEYLRRLIDQKHTSDAAYEITFADGFVLKGHIDLEPASFWRHKPNPLTWHLNQFWNALATTSPNKGGYTMQDIEFAEAVVSHYDLGPYAEMSYQDKMAGTEKQFDEFKKKYKIIRYKNDDGEYEWQVSIPFGGRLKTFRTLVDDQTQAWNNLYQQAYEVIPEEESGKPSQKNDTAAKNSKMNSTQFLRLLDQLRPIMPVDQSKALLQIFKGEESEHAVEVVERLVKTFQSMPKTYQTENVKTPNKIVHLHYFLGDSDWYIVEKDSEPEQIQAYGYVILNGDEQSAEWGYINIDSFAKGEVRTRQGMGVELDFHWTPKPFAEISNRGNVKEEEEEETPSMSAKEQTIKRFEEELSHYDDGAIQVHLTPEQHKTYEENEDDNLRTENAIMLAELSRNPVALEITRFIQQQDLSEGIPSDIQKLRDRLVAAFGIVVDGKAESKSDMPSLTPYELGRTAFEQGMLRVPALDKRLFPYLSEKKVGEGTPISSGWLKGWDDAHQFDTKDVLKQVMANNPPEDDELTAGAKKPETVNISSPTPVASRNAHEQMAINNQVRKLVAQNGTDRDRYSPADLQLLRQYEGDGGLIKAGAKGARILDQFFTPMDICAKMWGLALKYGFSFQGTSVLEPAVGSGNLLQFIPAGADVSVTAFDVDETCVIINKVLFPSFDIRHASFETMFFQGKRHVGLAGVSNLYDLVIGNPPYRKYDSTYGPLGESKATGATTFVAYFITRGVDVLKQGGLLVYIIPNTFLSNNDQYNDLKERLASKCELIDAYRLPNGIFGRTDEGTDIIVLRKK